MRTLRGRVLLRAAEVALRRGARRGYYRLAVAAVDHENVWRQRQGWQPIFVSEFSRSAAKGQVSRGRRTKQTAEAA